MTQRAIPLSVKITIPELARLQRLRLDSQREVPGMITRVRQMLELARKDDHAAFAQDVFAV